MKKLLTSLATLAGFAALVGLFLPLVQIIGGGESGEYAGWKVVIGYKEEALGIKVQCFKFSIMNALPFLLVLIGAGSVQKGGSSAFFAALCFAGAAFLFYKSVDFLQFGELFTLMGTEDALKDMFELGQGGQIAMYASCGAAACSLVASFISDN